MAAPRHWDLFCRVIDNHGDLGVCWRLACDLASRGERVRLWVDDASALAWMAPPDQRPAGVQLHPWPTSGTGLPADQTPGEVVVEAFGCALPEAFVACMARRQPAPVWLNLEYLSAEDYVLRSHQLPSPQFRGPGAGLVKHFFYPGFTPGTGGLLREPGLAQQQQRFDAVAWRQAMGLQTRPGEPLLSLFCYPNPALPAWLANLAHPQQPPTLLAVTPGLAAQAVRASLGDGLHHGQLRLVYLPPLSQPAYDQLLWACDTNLVRGEDSFVRAQWAGKPFVWQAYPQDEGAHLDKLDAFLACMAAASAGQHSGQDDQALALAEQAAFWRWWNGDPAFANGPMPAFRPSHWAGNCQRWRQWLWAQGDLVGQLLAFVQQQAQSTAETEPSSPHGPQTG